MSVCKCVWSTAQIYLDQSYGCGQACHQGWTKKAFQQYRAQPLEYLGVNVFFFSFFACAKDFKNNLEVYLSITTTFCFHVCVSFAWFLVRIPVGSLWCGVCMLLPQSKNMHISLIDEKCPQEWVLVCLSVCGRLTPVHGVKNWLQQTPTLHWMGGCCYWLRMNGRCDQSLEHLGFADDLSEVHPISGLLKYKENLA